MLDHILLSAIAALLLALTLMLWRVAKVAEYLYARLDGIPLKQWWLVLLQYVPERKGDSPKGYV